MKELRPIRTKEDHAAALAEIMAFDDGTYEPGTPASDRLDVLVTLVEAYEAKAVPMPTVDPISILHHAINSMGRSQAELAELLGSRPRASEILGRKRPLTLEMIRVISKAWRIPPAALTVAYDLTKSGAARRGKDGQVSSRRRKTLAAT